MALTTGTRLGPYEIQSPLGAGGMGEVYKARDTRLDRTVAIKVLPEHVATDPELRQRFEREAKTLAALSHPHICLIHDVGSEQGVDYLVMEHLEGETLAQRLSRGALPLDQALQVAIQIADALDKAHRKGIVHRDLKPGNIMLTKAGAKLLDFGLAKLRPAARAGAVALSQAPTVTSPFGVARGEPITGAGSILGTFQYMAPEQVEGQEADARTDIFAFGAVVYEMVTGRKAFEGKSQASLIAAILERDPAPMSSLQPVSPPSLGRVVRKCLAKDPDRRWQSANDLHDELRWIADADAQAEATAPQKRGTSTSDRRRAWTPIAAVAVLGMIALAIPAVRHLRETPPPAPPETRLEIVTPPTDQPTSFALSPDGRQIVFVASGDGESRLWLRSLATTTAQPLAGTVGATYPFWSPDGRAIGFFTGNALKRLDIGGGAPQSLAAVTAGRGGTWNADGVILFSQNARGPLFRVPASGGEAVAATKLDRQTDHRFPVFLPDGRQFLFYVQGTPDTTGIFLGSLDSADIRRLTPADTAGVYLSSGWLLWVRGGTLVAQRLDLGQKALTGDPVTLADPVAIGTSNAGAISVSVTGFVAYRAGAAIRRQLVWVDRTGKALGTMGGPDENGLSAPSVSPDGRRVAVQRTVGGNLDIWLLDGSRTSRFTFDAAQDRYPIWSPDGSRIAFDSDRTGAFDLYQKSSSGVGVEELLAESAQTKVPHDWSADGRFLLYVSIDPQTGRDLWVLPVEGNRKPWVFLKTSFDERQSAFSPDGRWVAYESNESGRYEIHVRALAAPVASDAAADVVGQWQVSTAGGVYPRWRPDGKELYYLSPTGAMMAAPIVVTGSAFEPGAAVTLFPTRIYGGGVEQQQGRQYDVTRDGRFLINAELDNAAAPITLLMNWNVDAQE
jgi:serine/threonine protein kinase/Tol biopolymer transport system component